MIGGIDVTVRTKAGASALDFCIRIIRAEWPRAVFDDATGDTPLAKYEDLRFRSLSEVFVYRDTQAAEAWERLGADPAHENSMIHLLLSASAVTIVVDSLDDPVVGGIVRAIHDGLRSSDILNMRACIRIAA